MQQIFVDFVDFKKYFSSQNYYSDCYMFLTFIHVVNI